MRERPAREANKLSRIVADKVAGIDPSLLSKNSEIYKLGMAHARACVESVAA